VGQQLADLIYATARHGEASADILAAAKRFIDATKEFGREQEEAQSATHARLEAIERSASGNVTFLFWAILTAIGISTLILH